MSLKFVLNLLRPQYSRSLLFRNKHTETSLVVFDTFSQVQEKNKNTYIEMIKIFETNDTRRRNHVEFIYAALKHMKEFGVHKDLEVYKAVLEVLPKGRFIATNLIQAEFMHYPKQQQCAIDLLDQMEDNGVMPDFEMEDILMNTFGRRAYPLRKFWRMMYWMPKLRNASPWYLPQNMPKDSLELAKLAIQRITSVDAETNVVVYRTEEVKESIDHTWIVSGQSETQRTLLELEVKERRRIREEKLAMREKRNKEELTKRDCESTTNDKDDLLKSENENTKYESGEEALVVHGAYQVHLRDQIVSYFVLTGPVRNRLHEFIDKDDISKLEYPSPFGNTKLPVIPPTVHEQDDGTIYAVCATGTSTRDSLLSWIRLLERNGNPELGELPVVFTLKAPPSELVVEVKDPVTAE